MILTLKRTFIYIDILSIWATFSLLKKCQIQFRHPIWVKPKRCFFFGKVWAKIVRLLSGFFLQLLLLGLLDQWGICEFIAPLKVSYAFIWLRKFSLHCVHSQSHHLPHWTLVTKINLRLAFSREKGVCFVRNSINQSSIINQRRSENFAFIIEADIEKIWMRSN